LFQGAARISNSPSYETPLPGGRRSGPANTHGGLYVSSVFHTEAAA
jgi:hypothetical protein